MAWMTVAPNDGNRTMTCRHTKPIVGAHCCAPLSNATPPPVFHPKSPEIPRTTHVPYRFLRYVSRSHVTHHPRRDAPPRARNTDIRLIGAPVRIIVGPGGAQQCAPTMVLCGRHVIVRFPSFGGNGAVRATYHRAIPIVRDHGPVWATSHRAFSIVRGDGLGVTTRRDYRDPPSYRPRHTSTFSNTSSTRIRPIRPGRFSIVGAYTSPGSPYASIIKS